MRFFDNIGLYVENIDFNNGGKASFSDFMLFEEGTDLTYIDEYFESIKSFGQQEDKISILSSGKNLINFNEIFSKLSYVSVNRSDKTITATNEAYNDVQFYVYLRKGKTYKFSCKGNIGNTGSIMLGKQKGYVAETKIQDIYNINDSFVFNHDNGIYTFHIVNIRGTISSIQLEEVQQSTTYEPYKQDKKDILLQNLGFDEGLRGVNSIRDELNFIRNVAIKKIHKYTLTAELNWYIYDLTEDIRQFYIQPLETLAVNDRDAINCISSTLPSCKYNDRTNLVNYIYCNTNLLAILKPKSTTLEEFKQWLRDNPTTVYYKLAEPVETPLSENINLKTFNERTYITSDNIIKGDLSFTVPMNTAANLENNTTRLNTIEDYVDNNKNNIDKISKLEEGVVTSSLNIIDLQKDIKNDNDYTHYEGTNITINNLSKDSRTSNMIIKGQTLQNIFPTDPQKLGLRYASIEGSTIIMNPIAGS
jgi:hypothetical protein